MNSPSSSSAFFMGLLICVGASIAGCGGGGGGPVAAPTPRFHIVSVAICPGPPRTPTPTPTGGPVPTPTPTACPAATTTSVAVGDVVEFNAQGTFENEGGTKEELADITDDASTLWTSSDPGTLGPPGVNNGGQYQGVSPGCACIEASAGGVPSAFVGVTVFSLATPACIPCPTLAPTPSPLPTK